MGYTVHVRDAQVVQEMADRTVQQAGSLELWVNNSGVLVTGGRCGSSRRSSDG